MHHFFGRKMIPGSSSASLGKRHRPSPLRLEHSNLADTDSSASASPSARISASSSSSTIQQRGKRRARPGPALVRSTESHFGWSAHPRQWRSPLAVSDSAEEDHERYEKLQMLIWTRRGVAPVSRRFWSPPRSSILPVQRIQLPETLMNRDTLQKELMVEDIVTRTLEKRLVEKVTRSRVGEKAGLGLNGGREMLLLASIGHLRLVKAQVRMAILQRAISTRHFHHQETLPHVAPPSRDPRAILGPTRPALSERKTSDFVPRSEAPWSNTPGPSSLHIEKVHLDDGIDVITASVVPVEDKPPVLPSDAHFDRKTIRHRRSTDLRSFKAPPSEHDDASQAVHPPGPALLGRRSPTMTFVLSLPQKGTNNTHVRPLHDIHCSLNESERSRDHRQQVKEALLAQPSPCLSLPRLHDPAPLAMSSSKAGVGKVGTPKTTSIKKKLAKKRKAETDLVMVGPRF